MNQSMIKIGTWNIRGLKDPIKQKEVRSVILAQKYSMMGVVETKVRLENIQYSVNVCFPSSWKMVHNYSIGPVARILLGWDGSVFEISTIFSSDQLLVVDVICLESRQNFLLSVVYGHNSVTDRRCLWDDMRSVCTMHSLKPWIQLGDYVVRT